MPPLEDGQIGKSGNKPTGYGDSIDRDWTVPRELFVPIFHFAGARGFAWEQIATAALFNGLVDLAMAAQDPAVVAQLNDAMESLVEGSLRDFYVQQEAWQLVDSVNVHNPGEEALSHLS